jgi:hypothetical protein
MLEGVGLLLGELCEQQIASKFSKCYTRKDLTKVKRARWKASKRACMAKHEIFSDIYARRREWLLLSSTSLRKISCSSVA